MGSLRVGPDTTGDAATPPVSRSIRERQVVIYVVLFNVAATMLIWSWLDNSGGGTGPTALAPTTVAFASEPLKFSPPSLESPIPITVSADDTVLLLDAGRDYVIILPDQPVGHTNGLSIEGGRHVVLIGGEIRLDSSDGGTTPAGLSLTNQTGGVYVEGLRISGEVTAGIEVVAAEGTDVTLQNVVVETARAQIVSLRGKPGHVFVDGLVGTTAGRGLVIDVSNPASVQVDLNHLRLLGTASSGYLLWAPSEMATSLVEVTVTPPTSSANTPRLFLFPEPGIMWEHVVEGTDSPATDETISVGTRYRSPGYGPISTASG